MIVCECVNSHHRTIDIGWGILRGYRGKTPLRDCVSVVVKRSDFEGECLF